MKCSPHRRGVIEERADGAREQSIGIDDSKIVA